MDDDLLKLLEEEFGKQQILINRQPIEDFDNLSAEDMFNLIHHPFQADCPIQYKKDISQSVFEKVPFLKLVEYFLNKLLATESIKLTPKGNLPTKLVKELYGLGLIKEEILESGISKLSKEDDAHSIANVKLISLLSGLTKKKQGKITLTKLGKKLLKEENKKKLFQKLFETYGYKFNLGYHDGYGDKSGVQTCLSYTLFQLLQNGKKERDLRFYSDKMLKAYPHELKEFDDSPYSTPAERFHSCYRLRLFDRFLNWFNLVETRNESEKKIINEKSFVKSGLIEEIFEIKNENFKFKKEIFLA